MIRGLIRPDSLLAASVFAILFAVSYRDDASIIAGSRFFQDVTQSAHIAALKQYSAVAFGVPAIAAAIILLSGWPARNVLGLMTAWLTALALFIILRVLPTAPEISGKVLISASIFSLVVPAAMCVAGTKGGGAVAPVVFRGALGFAYLHVALNLAMAFSGQGYHAGRFLGTTAHPNFIGVQLALCAMLMLAGFSGRLPLKIFNALALAAALGALMLTGSRTALVVFGFGASVFWTARGVKLSHVLLVVGVLLLTSLGASAVGIDMDMTQYDRANGINTRGGAWTSLWRAVEEAPVAGLGEFPTSSENSYLRGWATIGIVYLVAYLGFVLAVVRCARSLRRVRARARAHHIFLGLLAGLLLGGVLEGFLLDTISPTIFLFLLSALALDAGRPKRMPRPQEFGSKALACEGRGPAPHAHATAP